MACVIPCIAARPRLPCLIVDLRTAVEACLRPCYDFSNLSGAVRSGLTHLLSYPAPACGAWPILRKGPFLLPTQHEAQLLADQKANRSLQVVLEIAEDLCYRGVVPRSTLNLLVEDEDARKIVPRRVVETVLVSAQCIRCITHLALAAH